MKGDGQIFQLLALSLTSENPRQKYIQIQNDLFFCVLNWTEMKTRRTDLKNSFELSKAVYASQKGSVLHQELLGRGIISMVEAAFEKVSIARISI